MGCQWTAAELELKWIYWHRHLRNQRGGKKQQINLVDRKGIKDSLSEFFGVEKCISAARLTAETLNDCRAVEE